MAGNTKLKGFTPEGKVQLERWGSKTLVVVSGGSLEALRKACYEDLPKKPDQGNDACIDHIYYDEHLGSVRMVLGIESASYLADCLESVAPFEGYENMGGWSTRLRKAVQDHYDYHNRDGEPGVT